MSRYRCYVTHTTAIADTGVHPCVQLQAASATLAARLALAVTGAIAVVDVIRIEEVAS